MESVTLESKNGMKLRKKDRMSLETILEKLKRAEAFIMNTETLICRSKRSKTTATDYVNSYEKTCYAITKEIGSDLVNLFTAINHLKELLKGE